MTKMKRYTTMKQYLADTKPPTRGKLKKMISTVESVLPAGYAQNFAYGIPTYKVNGKTVVHLAAYKTHIGFYPGSAPIIKFKDDLASYQTSKGTIRFPLDKPLPTGLIRKITKFSLKSQHK